MKEGGKVAAIGADLGGSTIRLALVDPEGGLSERGRRARARGRRPSLAPGALRGETSGWCDAD